MPYEPWCSLVVALGVGFVCSYILYRVVVWWNFRDVRKIEIEAETNGKRLHNITSMIYNAPSDSGIWRKSDLEK